MEAPETGAPAEVDAWICAFWGIDPSVGGIGGEPPLVPEVGVEPTRGVNLTGF